MILLNIILFIDVVRIFLFCFLVNVGLLNEFVCILILVCKCIKLFVYVFNILFVLLKIVFVFIVFFFFKVR